MMTGLKKHVKYEIAGIPGFVHLYLLICLPVFFNLFTCIFNLFTCIFSNCSPVYFKLFNCFFQIVHLVEICQEKISDEIFAPYCPIKYCRLFYFLLSNSIGFKNFILSLSTRRWEVGEYKSITIDECDQEKISRVIIISYLECLDQGKQCQDSAVMTILSNGKYHLMCAKKSSLQMILIRFLFIYLFIYLFFLLLWDIVIKLSMYNVSFLMSSHNAGFIF